MLYHSSCEFLCAFSKSGESVSPSPVVLLHSGATGPQSQMFCQDFLLILSLILSYRAIFFFLMWECHCVDCVGLIFFGAKAVFNMYICLLFPLCMKAIILLKGGVTEVMVT